MNKERLLFNEVTNMRLFLHENFYNDETNLEELCNLLENNFNLFTINYNSFTKTIQLKLKKTNMKKIEHIQLSTYYYQVINAIMINYFVNKYNYIWNLFLNVGSKYNLVGNEIDFLKDPSMIHNFYNITLINDNIISLHL